MGGRVIHDFGNHHITQFNHSLDHFARIFLNDPFALPLGNNRTNLILKGLLIRRFRRAIRQAMENSVDEPCP